MDKNNRKTQFRFLQLFPLKTVYALLLIIGVGSTISLSPKITKPVSAASPYEGIKYVWVIVEENRSWSRVKSDPNFSKYASQYAFFPNFHHSNNLRPSEPNYIQMEAGSNYGLNTNDLPSASNLIVGKDHLTKQLEAKGLTWKSWQESISPSYCPIDDQAGGAYKPKHNPMLFFDDVVGNPPSKTAPKCLANVRPYTEMTAATVANYNFITPNQNNDMHDGSLATAGSWLDREVKKIQSFPQYQQGAIIVTWDEPDPNVDDPIGEIIISPFVKKNFTASATRYDHSSQVKTIQNIFGLSPYLQQAAQATDLAEAFTGGTPNPTSTVTNTPKPTSTVTGTVTKTPTNTVTATTNPSCPLKQSGDADCDGRVTLLDFEQFRQEYVKEAVTKKADFDGNGTVNLLDFEVWRRNYTTGTPTTSPTLTKVPTTTNTPTQTKTPTATNTPTLTSTPIPSITLPPSSGNYTCDVTINPGDSISSGLNQASKVLCLKGGNYSGGVTFSKSGVTVAAVKGERPVINGCVSINAPMVLDGINVTWGPGGCSHMVKLNSSGVTIQNGEFWGARAYAALLVTNGATNFTIRNNYFHDTYQTNSTNQDHLIYVNEASNGVIERNIFARSPNGRGVKLGPPSGNGGPNNITIRYNTFLDNTGPSNIQLSYGSSNNSVYGNVMVKSGSYNITGYNLSGGGNKVCNNIGWDSNGVFGGGGLIDQGGNQKLDPGLTSDFRTTNSIASQFGKYGTTNINCIK